MLELSLKTAKTCKFKIFYDKSKDFIDKTSIQNSLILPIDYGSFKATMVNPVIQ